MVRDLLDALFENPVTVPEARRPARDGGVPPLPGLYAWWLASSQVLPAVPTAPHRTEPNLRLVYVGIAPDTPESGATLRSRILKNHLGAALAASTFRRSLAALLWQENGWPPRLTPSCRWALSPEDDAALRAWQERNLCVSWLHVEHPWEIEDFAIRELEPPFNLRNNREHPFYEQMDTARKLFVRRAKQLRDAGE